MANTPSAKKAIRKIAMRTQVNKARRSRVRTFIRKLDDALACGDKAFAEVAFKNFEPEIMRAVSKGVFHKNTAARKVSRFAKRLKALKG
ncbi:MAG: 30S ribosomal protein S20 [Bartonella sp.]|nr:30S ribosomal protein S20 [Bartonella sp.]